MLIKKLTDACGLPGQEKEVRDIIKAELEGHADGMRTDRLGNLIAVKTWGQAAAGVQSGGAGAGARNCPAGDGADAQAGPHIALCAHMDEVGLCIRAIDKDGYLKFASWGIDARVLHSKSVLVGKDRIPGVIGAAPIHLLPPEKRSSPVPADKLYIDIGAKNKEDAEKRVSIGDFAAFAGEYTEFGDHKIKAKALDDRIGCAAIIEVMKGTGAAVALKGPDTAEAEGAVSDVLTDGAETAGKTGCKLTGIFTTQEEVGLRGAAVAAYAVDADLAIVIEGTICADTAEEDERQVTAQGLGPVVYIADRTSVFQKKYIDSITAVAQRHGIPYQFKKAAAGGTDSARFHQAKGGTPCIGLAVACRYIHSPVSTVDKRDYENLVKLVRLYVAEFFAGGAGK